MKISILVHTHRFGHDYHPFTGGDGLSHEEIAERLGVDYEGEGTESDRDDEFLDTFEIETDAIPNVQDAAVLR